MAPASSLPDLVLASGSPRRRELLRGLGLRFAVRPADIDESVREGESPTEYVVRLAGEKAAWNAGSGELVLAADTVVVVDDELLGKPEGPADARRMLRRIRGRRHTVLTGVSLRHADSDRQQGRVETTEVRIAELSEAEIGWYVDTEEPLDKAGAYAIQDRGALFVEEVSGNYTNVVGLPMPATFALFKALGYDLRLWMTDEG